MRILFAHNRYQLAGGEDTVVGAEIAILRAKGYDVELFEENNDGIAEWIDAAATAIECVYSHRAARALRGRINSFKPDLIHVHNFFPRLTPSIHYLCLQMKIPVVQTLHNYRLLCPGATFLRNGRVCEDCMGKAVPWPAVRHGCYQANKLASAAVANMLSIHRGIHTWDRVVTKFIAMTQFARGKFIEGGLPGDRISIKQNFVSPDPGIGSGTGGYALCVGRLSEEKGIITLLEAWKQTSASGRLKIVGDGPLAPFVRTASATVPGIEWLGSRTKEEVIRLMAEAQFLVFPSICYESLPLVLIESFAAGLPVIASNHGAMSELISDGETGLLFAPGSIAELAAAIEWAYANPSAIKSMRSLARREYEQKYTAETNFEILTGIYRSALDPEADSQRLKQLVFQG